MILPESYLRYSPSVEKAEPDEAESVAELVETLRGISETTFEHSGHPLRSVHAKGHAVLKGELLIEEGLPPHLAQGLFSRPGRYPVTLRLSTTPGDLLDDNVSTPRGMAMKIHGVPGARLADDDETDTQDFVLVNGPAFLAPNVKSFLRSLKLLAATTDRAPALKRALSAALRGTERLLERVGHESGAIKSLGGHPETHPLGETFFSGAPIRYGDYIAKMSLLPIASSLTALTDAPVNLKQHPDGLREAVAAHFAAQGGEWLLRAQLCTDLETMPVEDSSVEWPQERSPFHPVARLLVTPQLSWSPQAEREEIGLSFSPWHCLEAHRPLGSVMRARKPAYRMSAGFRRGHAPGVCPHALASSAPD